MDNVQKREFDAYTMSWAIPFDSDPYQIWHSSQSDKGSNYVGFINSEVDKIVEDIRTEFIAKAYPDVPPVPRDHP